MNLKRMPSPYRINRGTQQIDMPHQQIVTLPLQQIHRKEISSARMPGASVVRHGVEKANIEKYFYRRMWRIKTSGAMRCAYCTLRGLWSNEVVDAKRHHYPNSNGKDRSGQEIVVLSELVPQGAEGEVTDVL